MYVSLEVAEQIGGEIVGGAALLGGARLRIILFGAEMVGPLSLAVLNACFGLQVGFGLPTYQFLEPIHVFVTFFFLVSHF